MGGVGYCRKFLRDLSKQIRLITSLFRKRDKFEFTPAMKVIVREILAELATPPILVFPWDDVADRSRPFHAYSDARIYVSGAALECGQSLTSAALPSIPKGTELRSTWKLAALSGPSNAFEATFGARRFGSFGITMHSKALAKWETTMHESRDSSSFSPRRHPRISQGKRLRKCRFPVPFGRACHGTRPQGVYQHLPRG